MTDLRPCSGCRRHVSIAERVCPFCAAPLAAAAPRDPRHQVLGRLSRAAVFAGAALATTACGGKKAKTENVNNTEQHEQAIQTDAGPTFPPDKGSDGTPDKAPVPMPYGAPPARRRVV